MKTTTWVALVVAAIVVLNLRTIGASGGKSRSRSKPAQAAPAKVAEKAENDVDGYGQTPEKARKQALKHAQDLVEELLARRLRGSGWEPPPELLDVNFLGQDNMKVIREKGPPAATDLKDEKTFVARYTVELTPPYLLEVQSAARQHAVQGRHTLLARLLGGILAVVLVTAGYLRLEETTRGYATKLLRLAAVIVLAVVGAGLWMTMP